MNPKLLIGKTLSEVAAMTHIFWKEIRVFIHANREDVAGTRLMSAYTVKQILDAHPHLASAVVFDACIYFGETILRILPAKEAPVDE